MIVSPIDILLNSLKANDSALLEFANLVVEKPQMISIKLSRLQKKESSYEAYEHIIRENLRDTLQSMSKVPNQPLREAKTWDDYILFLKTKLLDANTNLKDSFRNFIKPIQAQFQTFEKIGADNKEQLLEALESYCQKFVVRTGLSTAFDLLSGLLRIIPILWKQSEDQDITKDELINVFKSSRTQGVISAIANMHLLGMIPFINLLWRLPEEFTDTEKTLNQEHIEQQSNSGNPHANNCYNPSNFALRKTGLAFTKTTAELYHQAQVIAAGMNGGKKLGCPALKVVVEGSDAKPVTAIELVCDFLSDVIRLIPDQQFETMIKANPFTQEEIIELRKMQIEETRKAKLKEMFERSLEQAS